jgi:O-antigen ligase
MRFLLGWGGAILAWGIAISLLRDPYFSFSNFLSALDSYLPLFLVGLVNLAPSSGKVLRLPLLGVLVYMCVQIALFASGLLTWQVPVGQVVEGTTMLRIFTTMGAATGSALTVVMIFTLYWELSDSRTRVGRWIAVICALGSVLMLFSRGAITILIVTLVLLMLSQPSLLRKLAQRIFRPAYFVALMFVMIGLAYLLSIVGTGLIRRFELLTVGDLNMRTGLRTDRWQRAADTHGDAGYFGKGIGNVDPRTRLTLTKYLQWDACSHNGYLMIWYETGLPGLSLFVGMLLYWILRESNRSRGSFGFWFVIVYVSIGFLLESCVLSMEYMILMLSIMSVVSNRVNPGGIRLSLPGKPRDHRARPPLPGLQSGCTLTA